MAQTISNLAVGSKVKFGKIYGEDIVWYVADKNHDGYPSNSVTLLAEKIITLKCFDAKEPSSDISNVRSYGNSRYPYSNIRQWLNSASPSGQWFTAQHSADAAPASDNVLNGTNPYDNIAGFLNAFSSDEQNALLDTALSIYTNQHYGSMLTPESCTDKVFLLSTLEIGATYQDYSSGSSKLALFNDTNYRTAKVTAAAVANSNHSGDPASGATWSWWLRDSAYVSDYQDLLWVWSGSLGNDYACKGSVGIRPACNLSIYVTVTDSTDSDGCYSTVFNMAPSAPSSITVPTEVLGGQNVTVSWGESSDADGNLSGYKLEQCVNGGTWSQIYQGSARSYSAAITFGWTSVQFRVKAYDTAGAESTYTTSATRTVTNNRNPVITGSDADLGSFSSSAPTYDYTVTDEDGHTVTVVETIDGVQHKSYTCTLGTANTFSMTADEWLKTLNGSHTVVIKATDAMGATATRTMTFTKAVTSVAFVQTDAMAADDMPTKAILNVQGYFPTGCSLTVEMCNNGNDASPTWEDVTNKAQTGQKIFFANTTKTASSWGVKVRVTLSRGSATETCYITSIGGNFA